jgi:hypothetical protein
MRARLPGLAWTGWDWAGLVGAGWKGRERAYVVVSQVHSASQSKLTSFGTSLDKVCGVNIIVYHSA